MISDIFTRINFGAGVVLIYLITASQRFRCFWQEAQEDPSKSLAIRVGTEHPMRTS